MILRKMMEAVYRETIIFVSIDCLYNLVGAFFCYRKYLIIYNIALFIDYHDQFTNNHLKHQGM